MILFDDDLLNSYAKEHKIQPFRVKQILHELYKNQNIDWDEMTTLSKEFRQQLSCDFEIVNLELEQVVETEDTTKF